MRTLNASGPKVNTMAKVLRNVKETRAVSSKLYEVVCYAPISFKIQHPWAIELLKIDKSPSPPPPTHDRGDQEAVQMPYVVKFSHQEQMFGFNQ